MRLARIDPTTSHESKKAMSATVRAGKETFASWGGDSLMVRLSFRSSGILFFLAISVSTSSSKSFRPAFLDFKQR